MHAEEVYIINDKKEWIAYNLKKNGYVVIEIFQTVLFSTREIVNMPKNMMGRVSLKQKWSNQGIDYNSGSIDPTYLGRLWITMRNVGLGPVRIDYLDSLVSVEWTILERDCEKSFASHAFLTLEDLPADKRPVMPSSGYHTTEEIYRAVERIEQIEKSVNKSIEEDKSRVNLSLYLMIPVVVGVAVALIAIVFDIFLRGLH